MPSEPYPQQPMNWQYAMQPDQLAGAAPAGVQPPGLWPSPAGDMQIPLAAATSASSAYATAPAPCAGAAVAPGTHAPPPVAPAAAFLFQDAAAWQGVAWPGAEQQQAWNVGREWEGAWNAWSEWDGRAQWDIQGAQGALKGWQEENWDEAGPKGGKADEGAEEQQWANEQEEARIASLAKELTAAFPNGLQSCGSDKDFEFAQWKGAAVLAMEMRLYVAELPDLSDPQDANRLAHFSVHNANLAQLHQVLKLPIHRDGGRKARADYVEALIWELNENGSRNLLRMLLKELAIIAQGKITDGPKQSFAAMYNWIRSFEVPKGSPFTHSSFRGERDWCTSSGRLAIPSTHCLERLHRCIAEFYKQSSPLCFVEMQTPHHYLCEDIDVRGGADFFLPANDMNFWHLRATILYAMFPEVNPLQLTLYTASGWDTGKSEYKSSFHAIWNIVVNAERHGTVRAETIREFTKRSTTGWCEKLQTAMLQANLANTWEAVFDVSVVRCGSGRLPFCDKVNKLGARQALENRPLIPMGVWEFDFARGSQVFKLFGPKDLSEEEWVRRGSVRQIDDEGNMPPLSHYRPLAYPRVQKVAQSWQQQQQQHGRPGPGGRWNDRAARASGTMQNMKARRNEKDAKEKKAWVDEQRHRRRVFNNIYGSSSPEALAKAFKQQLDNHMGDPDGDLSTLTPCLAKSGTERWLWSTKWLKGAVEIVIPRNYACANLFVRGNKEQQAHFIEVLKQFTEPWEGDVPAYKGKGEKGKATQKGGYAGSYAGSSRGGGSYAGSSKGGYSGKSKGGKGRSKGSFKGGGYAASNASR